MLAVLPEYRSRGVGMALKLAQRARSLDEGVDEGVDVGMGVGDGVELATVTMPTMPQQPPCGVQ